MKTKTSKYKSSRAQIKPVEEYGDVPINQKMLYGVRSQLQKSIGSLEKKMDSRFAQVDSRFAQVDSVLLEIKSMIEKLSAETHRIGIIVEEQNTRNKYVLDGYAQLFERQDKLEASVDKRITDLEDVILKR